MRKQPKKIKMKRHKGAAKRFKLTGTGKVRNRQANRSHHNTKRSSKLVRKARSNSILCKADSKIAKGLLCAEGA